MLRIPLFAFQLGLNLVSHVLAGAYPPDPVDELAAASMSKLQDYLAKNPANGGCTLDTAIRRQEW